MLSPLGCVRLRARSRRLRSKSVPTRPSRRFVCALARARRPIVVMPFFPRWYVQQPTAPTRRTAYSPHALRARCAALCACCAARCSAVVVSSLALACAACGGAGGVLGAPRGVGRRRAAGGSALDAPRGGVRFFAAAVVRAVAKPRRSRAARGRPPPVPLPALPPAPSRCWARLLRAARAVGRFAPCCAACGGAARRAVAVVCRRVRSAFGGVARGEGSPRL